MVLTSSPGPPGLYASNPNELLTALSENETFKLFLLLIGLV